MPKFRVWCPALCEEEHSASEVDAFDEQSAAEHWAETEDWRSAEYWIVGGEEVTVRVRDPDGKETVWRVTGEAIPKYHADEIEEDDDA